MRYRNCSAQDGVGAFTYLRRVLESLLDTAREETAKGEDWNDTKFSGLKMDQKISALKGQAG